MQNYSQGSTGYKAPNEEELLGSAKALLREGGWGSFLHARLHLTHVFTGWRIGASLPQTPEKLAALTLGGCISMPTQDEFTTFIKTSESKVLKRPCEFSVCWNPLQVRG